MILSSEQLTALVCLTKRKAVECTGTSFRFRCHDFMLERKVLESLHFMGYVERGKEASGRVYFKINAEGEKAIPSRKKV